MLITIGITILFVIVLIALAGVSLYFAFSGYLPGRSRVGWALVGIYFGVFFLFTFGWVSKLGPLFSSLYGLAFIALLLVPQAPLLIKLLAEMIVPDPSKGLKLIKVHAKAESLAETGDLAGAIAEYERAVADDHKDFPAHLRLAELYCETKAYEKATAVYEALLKHGRKLGREGHCTALTRLADIYSTYLGDSNKARAHIATIIENYPKTRYAEYARERLAGF